MDYSTQTPFTPFTPPASAAPPVPTNPWDTPTTSPAPAPMSVPVTAPTRPSVDAFAPITPRVYEDPVYTPPVVTPSVVTPPTAEVFPPDTFVAPAPLPPSEQPTNSPEHVSYNDAHIQEIDITRIVPNPYQPRKVFNQQALEELAASIREHGVIQPLVVTETETGYEIVVGERRFRASQLAGLDKVPAIIKKSLGDQTKLEVALIENIQRQELNPIEEAQAYDRLIKTFNLTQDQVAKKVGKARPSISNTLRLLNLPAVIQRAVVEGKISEGHARALLAIPESEKQLLMFDMIIEQGMNVRQVEAKVREITVKRQLDAVAPDPHLMAIETELRGKLGTQVKIQRQGRGGRIMIEFFSEEDLQEIIDRMADSKAQAASGSSSGDYFTV